ncbi:MAG TPA: oxygenase MpaB family protein [Stellaceae bacterium]
MFGPGSMVWRVDREAAVFLGAGRALLLQLAHPWVAAAIVEHSCSLADPIGRFHRTFSLVFTMVFGTADQAVAAARRLYRRHAAISGVLGESAGAFPVGSAYRANDLAALRWVFATLAESAVVAYELVNPPLAAGERERYYAEFRLFAAFFGIPQSVLPQSWPAFAAYVEEIGGSDTLAVGSAARATATELFAGAGTWLRSPFWYRALTASLLPERLRDGFALEYGPAERRAASRALAVLRLVYPRIPARLRYVAPYHEACGRLRGQERPGAQTRLLNRLWIGRSSIAGDSPT